MLSFEVPDLKLGVSIFFEIHVLTINFMQQIVLNMNEHQARLLRLLGRRYKRLYFGSG